MLRGIKKKITSKTLTLVLGLIGVFVVTGGLSLVNQDVNAQFTTFADNFCSPTAGLPYFCDIDGDGYASNLFDGKCGTAASPFPGCVPAGCVTQPGGDCNDSSGSIHPGAAECDASLTGDGIDNDCDGQVDEGCSFLCGGANPVCDVGESCAADCTPEPHCSDGVDNDADGDVDCDDIDCIGNPVCFTAEICNDGLDNDGNGFADCADFACAGQTDGSGALCCNAGAGPDDSFCGTCQRCIGVAPITGGDVCSNFDFINGNNCNDSCTFCEEGVCEIYAQGVVGECNPGQTCQLNPLPGGIPTLTCQVPADVDPPTITITSSSQSVNLATVNWTASDNVGVVLVNWANSVGGSPVDSGSFSPGGDVSVSSSFNNIQLVSGTNTIILTVSDAAGNTDTDQVVINYTPPDTTSPFINIAVPSTPTLATSQSTINISGTASDNVGVTSVIWSRSVSGFPVVNGNAVGTNSWSVTGLPLQPGVNTITMTAYDAAGNTQSDLVSVTYTVPDTTPPTVTISNPTTNPTLGVTLQPISLGGTAADGQSGVVSIAWTNSNPPAGQPSSGTAAGTNNWSIPSVSLSSVGTNNITVTATNGAGLSSTDSIAVTYTFTPDTCSDTDGGNNPTVAGSISGNQGGAPVVTLVDSCASGSTLTERYCSPTNQFMFETKSCDPGFHCAVNGSGLAACVPDAEVNCSDGIDNDLDGFTDCNDLVDCGGEAGPGGSICCAGAGDCSGVNGGNCAVVTCDSGVTNTCQISGGSSALCGPAGNSCGSCVNTGTGANPSYNCQANPSACSGCGSCTGSGINFFCEANQSLCGVCTTCDANLNCSPIFNGPDTDGTQQCVGSVGCSGDSCACDGTLPPTGPLCIACEDADGDGLCNEVDNCPYVPSTAPNQGTDTDGLCAIGCYNVQQGGGAAPENTGTGVYINGYLCEHPNSWVKRDSCRGDANSSGCQSSADSCRAIFGGIEYMNIYINGKFLSGNLTLPQGVSFNPASVLLDDPTDPDVGVKFKASSFFTSGTDVVAFEAYSDQKSGAGVLMREIRGAFANINDTGLCTHSLLSGIAKRTSEVDGGTAPHLPLKCIAINNSGYSASVAPPVDGSGRDWLDLNYDDSSWPASDKGDYGGVSGPIETKLASPLYSQNGKFPQPIWSDNSVNYSAVSSSHVFCRIQF